jgi:hypothetical protein
MRSDPFWEFGSFGITKCHGKNLMHLRNAEKLNGARFAFAQGGKLGTKLVHLTPPVKIVAHCDRIEATWSPRAMPFRYDKAPILISNTAESDFPELESTLKSGRRATPEGRFSSRFRSSATFVSDALANELISNYVNKRRKADGSEFADSYDNALPFPPPRVDRDRERTYAHFLSEARGSKQRDGCTGRKSLMPCPSTKRRKRSC